MNAKLLAQVKAILADHRKRRRVLTATGAVAALVAVGVFVSLMVPAISMEQNAPLLEADPATVEVGGKVSVKVTATAKANDDTLFVLSEIGRGGSLASDYTFDDKGEAQVKTEDGKVLTLHRVDRSKEAAEQVSAAEQTVKAESTEGAQKGSEGTADEGQDTSAADNVPTDVDAQTLAAERDVVDEKKAADAQDGTDGKYLYWFVVPKGTSVSFSLDHVSTGNTTDINVQHRLMLRGASGTSYTEAIKALQDAMAKAKDPLNDTDQKGKVLQVGWTVPTPANDKADGAATDATNSDAGTANADATTSDDGSKASSDGSTDGLRDQTIMATLYADKTESTPSTEQGVYISLKGKLPEGATASAYPVDANISDKQVLVAYDITVRNADGSKFEPAEDSPITVTISSSALQTGNGEIEVYHADSNDDATTDADNGDDSSNADYENVGTAQRKDAATVTFTATHFSPYALTGPLRAPAANPGTLTTVDSRSDGITLNLFDYNAYDGNYATNGNSHLSDWQYQTGINTTNGNQGGPWRDLRFYPSGISPIGYDPWTINNYTGADPIALQGVVNRNLDANGYPHTTGFNGQSSNLSYLFNPSESVNGKTTYADVNHLFTKDSAGYYRYDSGWGHKDHDGSIRGNYAYYDKNQGSGGDFVVYDQTYTNDNTGQDASNDSVGFFPFNTYNTNKKNVKLNSYYNHHLGLTMGASFMIPEGKTVNGNNMVFNFSGDDDMWVFIDGVLVLDIGGVHQPVSGSINFTEGTVSIGQAVQNVSGQTGIGKNANLADVFQAAGKTWDGSEYSKHTIQCFYLERGGCYSDLSLSFNLPVYKPGQIHVTKTVDGPGSANYMDTGFKFKVFIETAQGSGQYTQYTGAVTKDDGTAVNSADQDGTYTLKNGEGFKVATQNQNLRYYVEEIDPGSAFSTTINGQAVGKTDDNGTSVVKTDVKPVTDPRTNYKNSVTGTTVSVQKKWFEQDGTTPKTTGLPSSVTLTLHRTWDTVDNGSTPTPTPAGTKHKVTFKTTSQAVSNATVTTIDDVADGGSVTFYPYGGASAWALPRSVTVKSGSGTLNQIGTQQYAGWQNVTGYKLTNVTSDVTVLVDFDAWVTTDHTRTDYAIIDVKAYDKATGGGGGTTPTPGTGTVTHHDEIVNLSGVTNPVTVTADTDWRAEWNGLPMTDDKGNPYTYYVDESTVPAGYEVVYENNGTTNGSGSHTGIPSGEITVKNNVAYTLPHTGGTGTSLFTLFGLLLASTAVVLRTLRHKRARGGME